MQKIWSRAAPFQRACRCYTCLANASNTALRRPPTHRSLPVSKSLTLFYSTVIAAAAAIDVKIKNDRSNALDDAIAALQIEVDAGRQQDAVGRDALRMTAEQLLVLPARAMTIAPNSAYAPLVAAFRSDMHRPFNRSEWTDKKLLRTELGIAYLTTSWLLTLAKESEKGRTEDDVRQVDITDLEGSLQDLRHRLDVSRTRDASDPDDLSDIPRPEFPRYDKPGWRPERETEHLNGKIETLLKALRSGSVAQEHVVRAVALTLLRSPFAPDANTYTMLLDNLTRFCAPKLGTTLVKTIEEIHHRPNEQLCAAILRHMIATNQKQGFKKWVAKLNNEHKSAVMLAYPWQSHLNESGRLKKVGTNNFQTIAFDQGLYEACIIGHLHFGDIYKAVGVYNRMKAQMVMPSTTAMTALIEHRAARKTVDGYKHMIKTWTEWKSAAGDANSTRIFDPLAEAEAYSGMLRACRANGYDDRYQAVLNEAQERGIPRSLLHSDTMNGLSELGDDFLRRRTELLMLAHLSSLHDVDIVETKERLNAFRAQIKQRGLAPREESDVWDEVPSAEMGTSTAAETQELTETQAASDLAARTSAVCPRSVDEQRPTLHNVTAARSPLMTAASAAAAASATPSLDSYEQATPRARQHTFKIRRVPAPSTVDCTPVQNTACDTPPRMTSSLSPSPDLSPTIVHRTIPTAQQSQPQQQSALKLNRTANLQRDERDQAWHDQDQSDKQDPWRTLHPSSLARTRTRAQIQNQVKNEQSIWYAGPSSTSASGSESGSAPISAPRSSAGLHSSSSSRGEMAYA